MKKALGVLFGVVLISLCIPQIAEATSQWARKYEMNCQSCHTSFPRLNTFGEKFARNGYQLPDTQDGDETKQKLNDTTFIDKVGNLLGMRISVSPAEVTTNTLDIDGSRKDFEFNFGDTKWFQFFTAGSLFKNASIFIETEIEPTAVVLNWFTLGYHNLFDSSLLNFRTGRISMMNWHAQSGRLRMIPNIKISAERFRPSQGTNRGSAEEPVRISSPVPGFELYGYRDFFLYSVGVSNGEDLDDPNQYKNLFGTLRFELPDGELAGSAISGWGMWGRDTAGSGTETAARPQTDNTFYRLSPAVNVRWREYDLIGAYVYGNEDNYNLIGPAVTNKTHGATGQLGYLISPLWFAAVQYDFVKDDQNSRDEFHKISESVSYMPRENMRIGLTVREDMKKPTTGRQHEFLLNVRSMF